MKSFWNRVKEETYLLYEDFVGRRQDVMHLSKTDVMKIYGSFKQLNQAKITVLPQVKQHTANRDIFCEVEIDFMESLKGCAKPIKLERNKICGTCEGSLVAPSAQLKKCSFCKGLGY
jgi:DnaJ-class molecular chaperone